MHGRAPAGRLRPPPARSVARRRGPGSGRSCDPAAPCRQVDAVVLTGGSAFGLAACDGVVRWCEERGIGYPTPAGRCPSWSGMVLYDLGVGDPAVRPGAAEGYAACVAARAGHGGGRPGPVGAGTGATIGKWRGRDAARPAGSARRRDRMAAWSSRPCSRSTPSANPGPAARAWPEPRLPGPGPVRTGGSTEGAGDHHRRHRHQRPSTRSAACGWPSPATTAWPAPSIPVHTGATATPWWLPRPGRWRRPPKTVRSPGRLGGRAGGGRRRGRRDRGDVRTEGGDSVGVSGPSTRSVAPSPLAATVKVVPAALTGLVVRLSAQPPAMAFLVRT